MIRQNRFSKTKIVTTWGPAITGKIWDMNMYNDPANANKVAIAKQTARDVIKTGANVVRMNFSHGSFEEHGIRIKMAREAAEELGLPISLLCDTKGPELRLLEVDGEPAIEKNSKVTIHCKDFVLGNANEFSVSTKTDTVSDYNMAKDLTVGNLILVDDGKLQLHIDNIDVEKGLVFTTALNNHLIKTKKRLNLPGAQYSLPYMSEHDQKVVKFACDNDFDYIAPSFITCKEDIEEIKKILRENGKEGKIKIISKPENTKAIEKIDEIIKHSDGVMVPRGDLGMEIPFYEVPYWERYIINQCRLQGKPCIVATQMLDSMEKFPSPTRAEVTDVFYASKLGTDATMLSGETANGQFPAKAVWTMNRINLESEFLYNYKKSNKHYNKKDLYSQEIMKTVNLLHKKSQPKGEGREIKFPLDFIVISTNDEKLIQAISNGRLGCNVIVITNSKEIYTQYGVYYGILPYFSNEIGEEGFKKAVNLYSKGEKKVKALLYKDGEFSKV